MPSNCSECGTPFFLEPGFYYGAMYVSYALTIAMSLAVFFGMFLFWRFDIGWFLTINSSIIILCSPLVFRYSRAIWINLFVSYNDVSQRKKTQEKA